MQFHWKVLLWMVAGVLVGLAAQMLLEARAYSGGSWRTGNGGIVLERAAGPIASVQGLAPGDLVTAVVRHKDSDDADLPEARTPLANVEAWDSFLDEADNGEVVWLERGGAKPLALTLSYDPDSTRAWWVGVFSFFADIFMGLLKMLIVPLVLTSIVTGVSGVGDKGDLGRLGGKTFGYYVGTSLLAVLMGQVLVNLIQPGKGAVLGLGPISADELSEQTNFIDVLRRMVPANVFDSLSDNGAMLQIIFFALLFGIFMTRTPEPHGTRMRQFFESAFEVMLRLAQGVLALLPYGVFFLMARVVANTGFAAFKPLFLYMVTVTLALVLHSAVTLPLVLRFVGRISPVGWFRAMSPALMTAFSTSSSSMTLPVTLETVEKRGKVSNKVTSFTLPLGATINMDGTALYECIGVIFLAQYYAGTSGFELTLVHQGMVVMMALLASIGAAGIPSAGLVMMLSILSALGLPLEGAALLLAVDRPLDMLRTVVNVWSDSCGAAVIARSEGEEGPATAGAPG